MTSESPNPGGYLAVKYAKNDWRLFVMEDDNRVFLHGPEKFTMCAMIDGQPFGDFDGVMAAQIGTLVEQNGEHYIVADSDDYFEDAPRDTLITINGRLALKLGGFAAAKQRAVLVA